MLGDPWVEVVGLLDMVLTVSFWAFTIMESVRLRKKGAYHGQIMDTVTVLFLSWASYPFLLRLSLGVLSYIRSLTTFNP